MDKKFVLIGGGSFTWTHRLVTDIACLPSLKGMHIVLQDINPDALEITRPLCEKISVALNADLRIESTTDLDSALKGADFVGLTISTAGQEGNALDHSIPTRHGVLQTIGDTVGPGGWSRALRNIPVVVDIIRKVEMLAPQAWFFNYSNPMTVLTRTLQKVSSVKSIGLCHELQGFLLHVATFLGVDWEKDIQLKLAGINHLIWVLEMSVCGKDGLALLKEYHRAPDQFKALKEDKIPEELKEAGGVSPYQDIKFDILERTGKITAAGDAHTAEFFSHYLRNEESIRKWGLKTARKAHTFAVTGRYEERKENAEALLTGKKKLWLKHSHEHASRIMAALLGDHGDFITPVNTANIGQIDNLPRDAVVETLAVVNSLGVQPLPATIPQFITLQLMRHIPIQEMIVEAGLTGNKDLAVLALTHDPLIPDPDIAKKIADDVFVEFKEWLPQFNGEWSC